MLNRTQTMRGNTQFHAFLQCIGDKGHILQVGQKGLLGPIIGVGNVIAYQPSFTCQFANSRHHTIQFLFVSDSRAGKEAAVSGILMVRQVRERVIDDRMIAGQSLDLGLFIRP